MWTVPGVELGFSICDFIPKVYLGELSKRVAADFSGAYSPGAINW